MKTRSLLVLALAVTVAACSRNPDPEYAPDTDAAPATEETVVVAPAAPAATPLSEEETMRLGREAVQLMFDGDMATLWPRFDADVQAQAVSAESFGDMMAQVFGQIGAEMDVVEEEVVQPAEQPGLSVYRRRSSYLALGGNADLFVAFNADGTIAGVNIRPSE